MTLVVPHGPAPRNRGAPEEAPCGEKIGDGFVVDFADDMHDLGSRE